MKKFIMIAVSLILCFNISISAFAAIPEGWREMTDKEIESTSGDFIEPERNNEKNKSRSTEETTENGLIQIDKNLNIDCSNGNITDLTKYLEENVEGFDSNLFKVKVIHNSIPGENYYTILYGMEIGEFQTPYEVIVFVEEDKIEYSATFNKSDIENLMITPIAFEEDNSLESKIEAAKREARKEVPDDAIVEEQIVKKVLNEDLVPMLFVKTSCIDEYGGVFVLYYEYSLDEK